MPIIKDEWNVAIKTPHGVGTLIWFDQWEQAWNWIDIFLDSDPVKFKNLLNQVLEQISVDKPLLVEADGYCIELWREVWEED